ncbi:MAG TPA: glycosyltransferase 87 family protein [Candidatus Limnocylindrales bacterium]|nr:glycosyltransferase 87 family protein [Candidatus Limnocylindrales bacterium]
MGVVLLALGVLATALAIPIFTAGPNFGYDFAFYYAAANRLAAGSPLYPAAALAGPFVHGIVEIYAYAPVFAVLVLPLTTLPAHVAAAAWLVIDLTATVAACALMPVAKTTRAAVLGISLLSFASLVNLNLGSVNGLLLLGLVLAWRLADRPLGGLATALSIAVRPALGLVPVGWALQRRPAAVGWAIVAGLALVAITVPVAGFGAWTDWLAVLANDRFAGSPHNGSVLGVLAAAGAGPTLQAIGSALALAGALAALWRSRRRDDGVVLAVAVSGSLLASPLLWDHYLLLLAVPAAVMADRGRAWGLALPLLSWLPWPVYPIVALLGTLGPLTTPAGGGSGRKRLDHGDPITDLGGARLDRTDR